MSSPKDEGSNNWEFVKRGDRLRDPKERKEAKLNLEPLAEWVARRQEAQDMKDSVVEAMVDISHAMSAAKAGHYTPLEKRLLEIMEGLNRAIEILERHMKRGKKR